MGSDSLSVRLDPETRRLLDEEAVARNSGGASTLARTILEHEVRALRNARVRSQIDRVLTKIADDPAVDLWGEVDFLTPQDTL